MYIRKEDSQIVHTRGSVAVRCRDPCIRDKRIMYTLVHTRIDTARHTHTHLYIYKHAYTEKERERERERENERMSNERKRCTNDYRHATHVHTRERSVLRDPPNSHQTHCIKSSRVGDEARGRAHRVFEDANTG
ncbi:hypothetical protein K0M31_004933 [Melipona bicolor]|uniref:Uncharacterized protein n=1 Tax=Melipona bicolor TaxID=60889 RepID=A0AA40FVS8_9HYME|nr:hypothetical protein K0M31_004933 [Melipona bicolor]